MQDMQQNVLDRKPTPIVDFRSLFNYKECSHNNYILLSWKVRQTKNFNRFGARIPLPTKMNLTLWDSLLENYHDREVIEWLKFGWPIGVPLDAPEPVSILTNHKGATSNPTDIDEYFQTEIAAGASIGPFLGVPHKNRIAIAPLNTRDKRNSSQKRVILDLSFPKGHSVNDLIPKHTYLGQPINLTYPNIDILAKRVFHLGRDCLIYRVDEKRSFRQNPIDPYDYGLIGMYWKGMYFWDINSPQGLRTGAMFCQRVTDSIRFIMNNMGFFLLNYLDDLHGCEEKTKAWNSFRALLRLMENLGRDVAPNKTTKPTDVIEVLGVWFDVMLQIIAITPTRMEEILYILQEWKFKGSATKKEMQQLIGKLQFVSKCVRPGRIFISRLLRWMKQMTDWEVRNLDDETRKDIRFWYEMLPQFSGVSIMWHLELETPDTVIASDSCLTGCGAHTESEFFHSVFPDTVLTSTNNISEREVLTVCASLKVFGHHISGKKVVFYCDNQASVACINSGRAHNAFMQKVLREIAFVSTMGQFWIRAKFLQGKMNRKADILSRWHLDPMSAQKFADAISEPMTEIHISNEVFNFVCDW